MKNRILLLLSFFFIALPFVQAQQYSLLIKGGRVLDPKNNIDAVLDVAMKGDTIMKVAKNIEASEAVQVVNAKGLVVTPGLIDLHSHNFYGTEMNRAYSNGPSSIAPDGFTFRTGVTTVVDAGCAGWKSYATFKRQTIDISRTRVLVFLNIVGEGMRGGHYEQNIDDMDPEATAKVAKENADNVVGIKLAHFNGYNWMPLDRAVEAGKLAGIPVMVDFGGSKPVLPIEELFMDHLRPGDIFTHCFAELDSREPIVDPATKKVKPFVYEARKKGIVFDVGYGGISFAFSQGIPAVKSGFYPNTISTDIHIGSMNNAMKDMLNVMSKFMAMGMDFKEVIKASTWAPAQAIHKEELGNLSVGSRADVTVLRIREADKNEDFGFWDYTGKKINAKEKLEAEVTVRAGKVVYDLNGLTEPIVVRRR
ncbi:amidohydrolase/deacetylase family metallohydrolase [Marinilongibacter aquaticus]|uniref:amidohydrolase/deacetylase family metallohydrolase n=1 Tax=Marinilongibacter aquaticus TaxID=2975157 RepID=UPI0021BDACC6|nr:amidohydrolase/deacetylase family metallohydrolase [Marinilongibacter aquaticus]UBM59391.1 amidohydrolase/deacetylase family metallohydrolase [Marinilongibacter aquaticus]